MRFHSDLSVFIAVGYAVHAIWGLFWALQPFSTITVRNCWMARTETPRPSLSNPNRSRQEKNQHDMESPRTKSRKREKRGETGCCGRSMGCFEYAGKRGARHLGARSGAPHPQKLCSLEPPWFRPFCFAGKEPPEEKNVKRMFWMWRRSERSQGKEHVHVTRFFSPQFFSNPVVSVKKTGLGAHVK